MWAILDPVGGIALLSLVFAAFFDKPPLGISFPTFYATGMLLFGMFNDVHSKIALSLLYSKQLLAYPTVTFVDAILARFILNTMTECLVAYIVFTVCFALFETRTNMDFPVILQAWALTAYLALGIGTLNCYLFARFEVMQRAWSIMMRPGFILSGTFFIFDTLPEKYQNWLWWNPLVHNIGISRSGFYSEYDAAFASPTYVIGLSTICLVTGLMLLRRHYRTLLSNH